MTDECISLLRQRMIEDMSLRNFGEKTQKDYIRAVKNLTIFLQRSPDTASNEDLRLFQLHLTANRVGASTINGTVTALRFFFTVTLDRTDVIKHLTFVPDCTAHRLEYRFRLHRRDLPGKPDLVFVSRKKIVFLHGCYWHGHGCKVGGSGAKSNQGYWGLKIARNRERDDSTTARLRESGWKVLVVWECETRNQAELASRLRRFLK